jgi:hypothetical protein
MIFLTKMSPSSGSLGERAGFKCEYCGRDSLGPVNDYKDWQEDHIIPKSKFQDPNDESINSFENLAVSCRNCNFNWNRKWDPRLICGENANREELINAVRKYVAERKTKAMEELTEFRKIVYGQ